MFHANLTDEDLVLLREGQRLFLLCQFLPMVYYYLSPVAGFPIDAPVKFPASISHTIRKGPPKYLHHVLWLLGWWKTYSALNLHAESDSYAHLFLVQMVLTGVVCVILFPVGQRGTLSDAVHFVSAFFYMLDHIVLFSFVGTAFVFRLGFYVSFALFLACFGFISRVERKYHVKKESDANAAFIAKQRAKLPPAVRGKVWWADLGKMVFENSMFVMFVLGMDSAF
jgi:hypothetical protein